ncbi:MAG: hypothetical protein APF76_08670 [Desulfitibacter sp. BRH_c19]|nr:MAG: hypothetical protein APF76_08670 [Desulfitibacter sp. BRH_c19]
MLSIGYIISISVTLVFVAFISILASNKVKTSSDFCVGGRKLGSVLVSGSMVGAFVGGTSTVGTAQVAYLYGISGIWFTLGAGLSCLFLALFLAKPLRKSEVVTIPQLFESFYGKKAALWSVFFVSIGILVQVAAQVLSAVPVLTNMFALSPLVAVTLIITLIVCYSVFGGIWSTGYVGIIKTILLSTTLVAGGFIAYRLAEGITGLQRGLGEGVWFSIFPHGIGVELGAGISVIVGFISTQTYLQIIFSAKSVKTAQRGSLIAAILIPLTGLASVLIGMFMRVAYPDINPASALPMFVILHLGPGLGGIVLATLILSLVMTGAALTLGITTIIGKDIYQNIRPQATDKEMVWVFRFLIILISSIVFVFVTSNVNSLILEWAFLSMALRGATVFLPLLGIFFLKDRISPKISRWAILIAPVIVIFWSIFAPKEINPLYPGVVVSFLLLVLGYRKS